MCPVLSSLKSLIHVPIVSVVSGAGTLTEYAHASIRPWILNVYKQWLTSSSQTGATALRKLTVDNYIDKMILQAAFGDDTQPELVDFGARYALELTGVVKCQKPIQPQKLLIWRLHAALPDMDGTAAYALLTKLLNPMLQAQTGPKPWKVTAMESDLPSYQYKDLQEFSAVLMIPWDWLISSFLELLRLGRAVILPSPRYMHALISVTFWARSDMTVWKTRYMRRWSQLVPEHWEGFSFGTSNKSIENIDDDDSLQLDMLDYVASWWTHTEYMRQPTVRYFENLYQLMTILGKLDSEHVCNRLQAQTKHALARSAHFYQRLLQSLRSP
eukprot:TRINITY_DN44815_c0_g1_i1.p1 TRINITY_DN44815_c0_g1~~TRINITY_DN44815_c0_g1_i1.p1  ORF type:complete len:354 (+),score=25.21 TRINITY_DN44815_c0_g1_i1:79-1062(+)